MQLKYLGEAVQVDLLSVGAYADAISRAEEVVLFMLSIGQLHVSSETVMKKVNTWPPVPIKYIGVFHSCC